MTGQDKSAPVGVGEREYRCVSCDEPTTGGLCNHCMSFGRVDPNYRGVCYREAKLTIADYDEAIADLRAARRQLKTGSLMGCSICGDSGHAPQDGCYHDPLFLARQWTAATGIWRCWHCGFVATNEAEAVEHFGRNELERAVCDGDSLPETPHAR